MVAAWLSFISLDIGCDTHNLANAPAVIITTVAPGVIDATAEFETDPGDELDDGEESDSSDEAVDPPVDESPTPANEFDVSDNELSSVAAVVDELSLEVAGEVAFTSVELELVFEIAAEVLSNEPEVVPPAPADDSEVLDPAAALDPVSLAAASVEPVDDDKFELDVEDPGHTNVSPLHIWPLEQSLNVYWQLIEHNCAGTEVSVVQEQL
ncbi:unnamed protein product [Phytophthora fragariaefolia]|uniref:Unnamed protein product n=1 Tax=Phytophthora fragariaefolia TaxID=1490495 RepID=A0A9W6WV73_9STRA|nr:unnamed protein product [Phytophthora fragariaefolia]